jgi:ATP-dependent Clp protease adaptor protein ClpS
MAKDKKLAPKEPEQEALVLERNKIQEPEKYVVILHNDDFTTQDFVVFVLVNFFHKNQLDAQSLMLKVHREGKARVGLFSKDIAESKAQSITSFSRQNGMPLKVTTEPA